MHILTVMFIKKCMHILIVIFNYKNLFCTHHKKGTIINCAVKMQFYNIAEKVRHTNYFQYQVERDGN